MRSHVSPSNGKTKRNDVTRTYTCMHVYSNLNTSSSKAYLAPHHRPAAMGDDRPGPHDRLAVARDRHARACRRPVRPRTGPR